MLPVHNEADIIERVFGEVARVLEDLGVAAEIILVENGSSDASLEVISELARQRPATRVTVAEKGYGSAVLAGLAASQGEYLAYMPSDGQVELSVLPRLWELARTGEYDVVKVKRTTRESFSRRLVSRAFAVTLSVVFGTRAIDVNGSPRIFSREHFRILDLRSRDSFIDAELLIKATHLGWTIKEIPMPNVERYGGTSTRSPGTFLEFLRNILRYRTGPQLPAWKRWVAASCSASRG